MPKILTDAYKDKVFVLPYTDDKKECAYIKPLTDKALNRIRREASKESGTDEALFNHFFLRGFLQESIVGWEGFFDAAGQEIPYSLEMVKEICECDPEFATGMALRIRNVARFGELDDRKN